MPTDQHNPMTLYRAAAAVCTALTVACSALLVLQLGRMVKLSADIIDPVMMLIALSQAVIRWKDNRKNALLLLGLAALLALCWIL